MQIHRRWQRSFTRLFLGFASCLILNPSVSAQTLEQELQAQPLAKLVDQARQQGDAARGAIVFFQQAMVCSKCHTVDGRSGNGLGPDLAATKQPLDDSGIVEAVLFPSKSVRQGFETASIVTADATVLTGLLVERTESQTTLREASGKLLTIPAAEIEKFSLQPQSIMPAGQVNQLSSSQQFFDLVRYVMEIRDGGVQRAAELQPSAALLTIKLPEYESRIDHAGLIRGWNGDSLKRGEALYRRVCANCHGTATQVGSLPTAPRFAESKFKNGSDPLAMYNTLTRGFGFMAAQTWMVPSQKYDVIHYIRETYLRANKSFTLTNVDSSYLAELPTGDTFGPEASSIEAWSAMDYGPHLTHAYETPANQLNIAYKGTAIRLDPGAGGVARGSQWMIFDTDTMRVSTAWQTSKDAKSDRFIDWRDIQFNGEHGIHPRVVGEVSYANSIGPGWGEPKSGSFVDDQRVEGRDQRRYGPLPRHWAKFRGLYHYDSKVILSYSVGTAEVLELPGQVTLAEVSLPAIFRRTLNIGPRDHDLVLQVAETGLEDLIQIDLPKNDGRVVAVMANSAIEIERQEATKKDAAIRKVSKAALTQRKSLVTGVLPSTTPVWFELVDGNLRMHVAAGHEPLKFTMWTAAIASELASKMAFHEMSQAVATEISDAELDLATLIHGGAPRWPQLLETQLASGADVGPFAVDTFTAPESNPWLAQTRFTGLDFMTDGRIAACTWDGDVWLVKVDEATDKLFWHRIASGMYQPLGIKVLNDKIHVTCRDQLTVLHDLNGDEEIDFYQCLNNDHQVTEHFHEFAMGLQVDEAGNFYYAKSARHALPAVVPHHGTLLRVSRDGLRTDILANGFRAANGVCMNPDGSFLVTDQEGHWNPKNRINWVTLDPSGKPNFYGNMYGYHDVTDASDAAMQPPLCWITNAFDRSPAELLWVSSPRWGPLQGSLLNLSYGYGKVFLVLHEEVEGVHQGGMMELPIPTFPTGVMRGRFSPLDQQLYLCGMFSWAGNATYPGGLYRIRTTEKAIVLPVKLAAKKSRLVLEFTESLDPNSVTAEKFAVKTWSLKRSANYGSQHHNERQLKVLAASLSPDGTRVQLDVESLAPTWCMEIQFNLKSITGIEVSGVIHNTIHQLAE